MKKFKFISFLFIMIVSLGILCSCSSEQGPAGAQGEQGIQGEAGPEEPQDEPEIFKFYPINDTECAVVANSKDIKGNIVIPSEHNGYTVTTIGSRGFYGCYALNSVVIPNSVTKIEDAAFYECELASIVIPASVTSIGYHAFRRNVGIVFYCEALSEPSGWSHGWFEHEHHDFQLIVSVDNGFKKNYKTKDRSFNLDGFCFILRHVRLEAPLMLPGIEGIFCNANYVGLHTKTNGEIIDTGKHYRFRLEGTTRHPFCPMIPKQYYVRHVLRKEEQMIGESICFECEIVERGGIDTYTYENEHVDFEHKKTRKTKVETKRQKKYNYDIIITKILSDLEEYEIFNDYHLEDLYEAFRKSKFYDRYCYEIELGETERAKKKTDEIKRETLSPEEEAVASKEIYDENGELIPDNEVPERFKLIF